MSVTSPTCNNDTQVIQVSEKLTLDIFQSFWNKRWKDEAGLQDGSEFATCLERGSNPAARSDIKSTGLVKINNE